MYMVKKPESTRKPTLQRRAKTVSAGSLNFWPRPKIDAGCSPRFESARAGSRIDKIVAPAKTTKA